MTDALRPSTLGEILDRTANLYRGRFLVFLGIAFLPAAVILACAAAMVLFFAWVNTGGQAAGPVLVGVASILFFTVGLLVFFPLCVGALGLATGALNHAAAAAFENQTITIRGAYKEAWKRGWQYLWLLVLEGLIMVIAPGIVLTILIFVFAIGQGLAGKLSTGANGAAGGVVLLVLAATGLYALCMLLMLCLSFPACVVENLGALAALKRAISISKGTRGRILVLYFLGMVLRWGVSLVLMVPVILILTLVPGLDTPQHSQVIGTVMLMLIYGGSFLVRALTKPIYTIAQMLFYYDQRIRKEGFDIEWLMRKAGMLEASAPAPEMAPWMPVYARKPVPPAPVGSSATNVAAVAYAADVSRHEDPPPDSLPSVPGEPA